MPVLRTPEYTEDLLVEQNAIKELGKIDWKDYQNCYKEFDSGTSFLGRETKSEVVLVERLTKALKKLNKDIEEEAIKKVVVEITKDRSKLSLLKANEEVYKLIKNGVKVKIRDKDGNDETKIIKIVDFENPLENDFFLASQFWITGDIYTRRTDLLGFVNGLPLIFIELKASHKKLKDAYKDNLTDYKDTIPQLFWYNSIIILSNGKEAKVGSMTSQFEHFNDWKKIESEKEKGRALLDTMIKGVCNKKRFIDLLENFTLFTTIEGKPVKVISKNHQYLGVNNAVESFKHVKKNKGRLGVFWHTQGSGKSFSMIFFSQKILRKFEGNYTFLVVTDRDSLDTQIYQNFQNAGVVSEPEKQVHASSREHLKKLLKEDHRAVFTLIHKFSTEKKEEYPKLSDRDDIIIMTDEAHRTQYDVLALNMRTALPNAAFIGFTGTPLMKKGEEKTKETFGDYVSVYNFRESVEDKATVPLYYENRVPELKINNPTLNQDIYDIVDSAELDEKQEQKLQREFSKEYHLLTREDRLNIISKDILEHFINRGYGGKAMVVSIDKATAVKMYNKVHAARKEVINQLKERLLKAELDEVDSIKEKIMELMKLDMAVVVSSEQNEIDKFKKMGLDIKPHRERMVKEDLATQFKDPRNDFRIVFVCNMWMTGFDVPSLSTIYLDKPMKNHTLMQSIARVNRVFEDKLAGFIVDYNNVFKSLKKALAIYAAPKAGSGSEFPIQSKDLLVKSLEEYIKELNKFLSGIKIDADKIIKTEGFDKIELLDKATSKLVIKEEIKTKFLTKAGNSLKIYKAILPHKKAASFLPIMGLYRELLREIKSLDPEVDISSVMHDIENLLDDSIESKGYIIKESEAKSVIDLSKINFDKLRESFEKNKDGTELERLKNILSFKLKGMVKLNNLRINYQERLQNLIDDYNSGSINAETYFKELSNIFQELQKEENRATLENLTEEELALFDKLKKPELKETEMKQIKKVAQTLLKKLNPKLVIGWRKKQQSRAAVRVEIEKQLDDGLPNAYTRKLFLIKCQMIFQHFYDNYYGDGKSVYTLIQH